MKQQRTTGINCQHTSGRSGYLIWLVALSLLLGTACSSRIPEVSQAIETPLGRYKTNTPEPVELLLWADQTYTLCIENHCESHPYERVAVNYGVILIDFFKTQAGQLLERYSHGEARADGYFQTLSNIRLESPRPNDLAFNLIRCPDGVCASMGHQRRGVKFIRLDTP